MRGQHPRCGWHLRVACVERLAAALNSAISMPVVQQTFRRYGPRQMKRSLAHHHELLDAFRARDPQWARAVMTAHIRAALAAMLGR